MISIKVE